MKKNKKNDNTKLIVSLGVLFIFIGIFFLTKDYLISKKDMVYETMYFEITDQPTYLDTGTEEDEELDNDVEVNSNGEEVFVNKPYYIGRIEIPKIRLIKGFASIDSVHNDVKENVAILKSSSYPDVNKGNFILAAHAGSAWNSYFGKLYMLSLNDEAYVYYNGYKYTYKLVKVYDVEKTGYAKIYRDRNKTVLTLITCTQNNMKKMQTIYILEQIKKELI